jgi:D-psicose/D-tagatose/L-ribulose 3-epimerase
MKVGFNLLLWTTHFVESQFDILTKLKATGYDGVEIPIFDNSDTGHFRKIGEALKDNGLESTAVTVCPDEEHNAISSVAAHRQGALDHLKKVIDCGHAAGIHLLCGPYYQVLGNFSGAFPTETELEYAAEVHRPLADYAQQAGITLAIEPLNRFESHLLNTMEQAKSYVQRVNHPNFGTMYDTFHANIEEKKPLEALKNSLDVVRHIHISANDRGTPGKDHCPTPETIAIAKAAGYNGYLTIEAFGGSLPDLAAATRVWRSFFSSEEEVYTDGYAFVKACIGA